MSQNKIYDDFKLVTEIPPSFSYLVDWATEPEKQVIIERLRAGNRQTMNVRMMPTARFLVLRDIEAQGKIIGWQGLDYETNPRYAEKFSLHLDHEYRAFLLGLVLEHAFALHLKSVGYAEAFVRMDVAGNGALSQFRTNSGIFKQVDAAELEPEWVSQCQNCELYKGACRDQGFFTVSVDRLMEFGERRLGPAHFKVLPASVRLVETMIRREAISEKKYQAKWAA